MYICDYFWSTLTIPDNDRHQSTALLSCESLHTFTDIISVSLCSWLFTFFFKTLSKGRWIRGIRISKYRSLKSKINRLKTFPNNFQSNSENFLFVRTIENDTHDNTINNRNWETEKSGKRMRKYRKEILIFPTLFLFLILSRYFFLFLYPPIHVLLLLLPPSHSSSLFYILSVSLKRPSPAGV